MKNIFKLFGIITLVAVIGLSMTACGDDDGGGKTPKVWTLATTNPFTATDDIYSIFYGGASGSEKFIAGGREGKLAYSTDGITWTWVTGSPFADARRVYAIAYGNDKFVAGGMNGRMWTSTDGITWEDVLNSGFGTDDILAIAHDGNNTFIAGGKGNKTSYSTDGGSTWTVKTGFSSQINAIIYAANSKFYMVRNGGVISVSTDGINWTMASTTSFPFTGTQHIYGIANGGGKLVIGGTNGKIAYSTDDGATWTTLTNTPLVSTDRIRAIAYGNNKFVAVGDNGIMAYARY